MFAPRGTDPVIEAAADRGLAVEAACQGDYEKAIALVEPWAALALQHQARYPLFENRCRLMALYRLAGRMDETACHCQSNRADRASSERLANVARDQVFLG